MKRLSFFHYNPIELFPPAMNMITYLGNQRGNDLTIYVYTTAAQTDIRRFDIPEGFNARVFRIGNNNSNRSFLVRYVSYLWYYIFGFFHCLFNRPTHLLYMETMSAPVPLFIKRFLWKKIPLFIHYHEFMSLADYKAWPMANLIHRWERRMYGKASWVSHTNGDRMRLFLTDQMITDPAFPGQIMPNYPQRTWAGDNLKKKWTAENPIRLVYIGAVDMVNIYFAEFIDWVENQNGNYVLDVFSNQDTSMIESYASQRKARFIKFMNAVPYFSLPSILATYDVGVILYKGNAENFLYNAPNKLFEYLAIGLDVWYPVQLKGIEPYARDHAHPMVLPMDFSNMESFKIQEIYRTSDHRFEKTSYFAEDVYMNIDAAMFGGGIK